MVTSYEFCLRKTQDIWLCTFLLVALITQEVDNFFSNFLMKLSPSILHIEEFQAKCGLINRPLLEVIVQTSICQHVSPKIKLRMFGKFSTELSE
jgi:hypothetical protein